MKKWIFLSVFFGILVSPKIMAGEDWGASLGAAFWDASYDKKGDPENIWGPTVSLRYKNVTFVGQYFGGSFDNLEEDDTSRTQTSKDREDIDLVVSYRFLDYYYVATGYKMIGWEDRTKISLLGIKQDINVDYDYEGFVLGLGASYSFLNGFLVYGSGWYMPQMDVDFHQEEITYDDPDTSEDEGFVVVSDGTDDGDGLTFEAGIGYSYTPAYLTLLLGYRYQDFTFDKTKDVEGSLKGLRAQISFNF